MTSSVAFSNYVNRAFYDPEEEVLSTSNYNVEHRMTAVLNYNVNLFGYNTRFSLFGQSSSGAPYSLTLGFEGTGLAYGHALPRLPRARTGRAGYTQQPEVVRGPRQTFVSQNCLA